MKKWRSNQLSEFRVIDLYPILAELCDILVLRRASLLHNHPSLDKRYVAIQP